MTNYLFAYHGGAMPETPEAGQQVMTAWMQWYVQLGAAVVDGGNPVGPVRTIASDGSQTDGGGANPVAGYTVISAASMDEAVMHAKSCPHLAAGGSVEVCETIDVAAP